ncbi:MAG TPA: transglycosylase, partial [Synergistaceae bacterium]|nr:transglycosylase [Synergistaceae bacterium]
LSRLIERFGVTEYAVAAYNAGMGSVSRWLKEHSPVDEWIEDIPYKETNDYVKKVMANYAIYKSLYDSTGG